MKKTSYIQKKESNIKLSTIFIGDNHYDKHRYTA